MAWQKLDSVTLGVAGDILDSSIYESKTFQMMMIGVYKQSGTGRGFHRVGNSTIATGSNYAFRRSPNGGADSVFASNSNLYAPDVLDVNDEFHVAYYVNISGEEKLFIVNLIQAGAAGAAYVPDRSEFVAKWVNTSNQIDIQRVFNSDGTGDFTTDTNLSILGTD